MDRRARVQQPLSTVIREFPGRWVAVDRNSGVPRAAADTPYLLAQEIRSRQIKNIAIVRAPDPCEPELVGLG